jgi:acyl transferase domain-containing protein
MDGTPDESNGYRTRSQHIPELLVFSEENFSIFLKKIEMAVKEAERYAEQPGFLKWLAFKQQQEFNQSKHIPAFRAVLTAYGEVELNKKLIHLEKMIKARPDRPFSYPSAGLFYGIGTDDSKMAFLFPGQGSQYLGMGKVLAAAFPEAQRIFNRIGQRRFSGHTIDEIISTKNPGDKAAAKAAFQRLSGVEWTNLCLSVVGKVIFVLLKKMGALPHAVASHSFGDVSAFHAAGILSEDAMIRIHRYRGELGASCPSATKGCILVVCETAEKIKKILKTRHIDNVWIANYNTNSQTVISGLQEMIHASRSVFAEEKIVHQLIPISGAPHCPLAEDAAEEFHGYLEKHINFEHADCDVYSFLFGRKLKNDPDIFRHVLRAHIEKPVRFNSQIENMYADGIRIFVEVGPSDILTRFVEHILDGRSHIAVNTDNRKGDAVLTFLLAVAELFKAGKILDLSILWEGYEIPVHPGHRQRQPAGYIPEDSKLLQQLDVKLASIENIRSMQL